MSLITLDTYLLTNRSKWCHDPILPTWFGWYYRKTITELINQASQKVAQESPQAKNLHQSRDYPMTLKRRKVFIKSPDSWRNNYYDTNRNIPKKEPTQIVRSNNVPTQQTTTSSITSSISWNNCYTRENRPSSYDRQYDYHSHFKEK